MAGLSIYTVTDWQENTNYNLYDIYRYNNLYYYAIARHNSGSTFDSTYSDGIVSFNGVNKPNFFFIPGYNGELNVRPTVRKVQFGDGYAQRVPENINGILLPFNLTFDKRTDSEARAILHFLDSRKGHESFVFTPPFPFNVQKLFVAEEWKHAQQFADNHTITVTLQETPV